MRVLLADAHAVMREGLRELLTKRGLRVIAEASDGRDAVMLARRHRPDVVILEIALPEQTGLAAARQIRRACPGIGVVILTALDEDRYVFEAIQDGVRGYVLKTQPAEDLIKAIQAVGRGGMYLGSRISKAVAEALQTANTVVQGSLTIRERGVLHLVSEGKATKEIANLLNLSPKTITFHRTRIMKKLNIHNTAGLVRYAVRHGLIPP